MSKAQTKVKKIKNTIFITSRFSSYFFTFNYLRFCIQLLVQLFKSNKLKTIQDFSIELKHCESSYFKPFEPIWNKPSNNYSLSVQVVNIIIIFVNLLLIGLLASIIIKIQNFQRFKI